MAIATLPSRRTTNIGHPDADPTSGLVPEDAAADPTNPGSGFGDGRSIVAVTVTIRQEPWQTQPHLGVWVSVRADHKLAPRDAAGRPMNHMLAYDGHWHVPVDLADIDTAAAPIRDELARRGIVPSWFDSRVRKAAARFLDVADVEHTKLLSSCALIGVNAETVAELARIVGQASQPAALTTALDLILEARGDDPQLTRLIAAADKAAANA